MVYTCITNMIPAKASPRGRSMKRKPAPDTMSPKRATLQRARLQKAATSADDSKEPESPEKSVPQIASRKPSPRKASPKPSPRKAIPKASPRKSSKTGSSPKATPGKASPKNPSIKPSRKATPKKNLAQAFDATLVDTPSSKGDDIPAGQEDPNFSEGSLSAVPSSKKLSKRDAAKPSQRGVANYKVSETYLTSVTFFSLAICVDPSPL